MSKSRKKKSDYYCNLDLTNDRIEKALFDAVEQNFKIVLSKEINNVILEYIKGIKFITKIFYFKDYSTRLFYEYRMDHIIYLGSLWYFVISKYPLLFWSLLIHSPYVFKLNTRPYINYIYVYILWVLFLSFFGILGFQLYNYCKNIGMVDLYDIMTVINCAIIIVLFMMFFDS